MSDGKSKAEALIARNLDNFKKAGDALVENTVGRYVMETLTSGQEISTEGLRAWLKAGIAATPSVQGKIKGEADIARQLLEGAMRFLDSVAPPTCDK